MIRGALVIEGGAMRSLYATGVLDVLLENKIEFPYVIGSSAGTLIAANYVAKHIGRSARINIIHSNDPKYFGVRQFIKSKGNFFNFDYLYHSPINDLYPYNMNALHTTEQRFIITATNCKTGLPVYFERRKFEKVIEALTASCSLPLLSKIVEIDGYQCLDGGISTPIAIHKAIEDGNQKVVIILTRDLEYRKKEHSFLIKLLFKIIYKKYPVLIDSLIDMPHRYNQLAEEILALEKAGEVFVIRPKKSLAVSRVERNARKLLSAYYMGCDDMKESLNKMLEYLEA